MKKLILLLIILTLSTYAQETKIELPTADKTSNFVITDNAATPDTLLKLNGDGGFYFGGTYGTGTIPTIGSGPRLMWYPKKAAFRAGKVDGTQWNDDKIGTYSTALGSQTEASGLYSFAWGSGAKATGYCSNAGGSYTTASGRYAVAIGYLSAASGSTAVAIGYNTTASASYSTAVGYETKTYEYYATAIGCSTIAYARYSIAMGKSTKALGTASTAMGYYTETSGDYSTAMGYYTEAQAYASLVIGRYNVIEGTVNTWEDDEPLFVCGNGTDLYNTSNALTLYKNGDMTIAGTLTSSSDIRLKEEINPLESVMKSIDAITPITYKFKDTHAHPDGKQIGFSAQEIEKQFPELVKTDAQGYLSVDYAHMTAVLLKAVKEQQQMIDGLRIANSELRIKDDEKSAQLSVISEQFTEVSEENLELKNRIEKLENMIAEIMNKKVDVAHK